MIYYIKDLALRLGVSRITIINWEKRGFIKNQNAIKITDVSTPTTI